MRPPPLPQLVNAHGTLHQLCRRRRQQQQQEQEQKQGHEQGQEQGQEQEEEQEEQEEEERQQQRRSGIMLFVSFGLPQTHPQQQRCPAVMLIVSRCTTSTAIATRVLKRCTPCVSVYHTTGTTATARILRRHGRCLSVYHKHNSSCNNTRCSHAMLIVRRRTMAHATTISYLVFDELF